jgi:hypothetical protein
LNLATGVGSERLLAALGRSSAEDEAWLQSLETFCSEHAGEAPQPVPEQDPVVAVILLERVRAPADATPE